MSRYLMKYVGTYVVRAEYDQSTNDYPIVNLEDRIRQIKKAEVMVRGYISEKYF